MQPDFERTIIHLTGNSHLRLFRTRASLLDTGARAVTMYHVALLHCRRQTATCPKRDFFITSERLEACCFVQYVAIAFRLGQRQVIIPLAVGWFLTTGTGPSLAIALMSCPLLPFIKKQGGVCSFGDSLGMVKSKDPAMHFEASCLGRPCNRAP